MDFSVLKSSKLDLSKIPSVSVSGLSSVLSEQQVMVCAEHNTPQNPRPAICLSSKQDYLTTLMKNNYVLQNCYYHI